MAVELNAACVHLGRKSNGIQSGMNVQYHTKLYFLANRDQQRYFRHQ